MDTANIATVVISLIASLTAIATNRAANRAATRNTEIESKTTIEADAYNRARKFDTDTIDRQDSEIIDLREENRQQAIQIVDLREANAKQDTEIVRLRDRIEQLERELHPTGGTS